MDFNIKDITDIRVTTVYDKAIALENYELDIDEVLDKKEAIELGLRLIELAVDIINTANGIKDNK